MPRKIVDLESKILQAAHHLFLTKGYLEVSMKQVAGEAGTSVGNLYNYFPTKKDLFIAGRRSGLQSFQDELLQGVETGLDPFEILESMLLRLMETMEKWAGLWEDFLAETSSSLRSEDAYALHCELKEEARVHVIEHIDLILKKLAKGDPVLGGLLVLPSLRFSSSLVSLVKFLVKNYPGEREENRRYLKMLLSSFFRNRFPNNVAIKEGPDPSGQRKENE